jgi:hypothetical protein
LPQPPVPRDLGSRLLAAMPVKASIERRRPAFASQRRRFVIWAGASVAIAASCLLVVRFWPERDDQHTTASVVLDPGTTASTRGLTHRQPENSRVILPWFQAGLDLDDTEIPTYSWPIQEKSPLMASTAFRPDLFD